MNGKSIIFYLVVKIARFRTELKARNLWNRHDYASVEFIVSLIKYWTLDKTTNDDVSRERNIYTI